VSGPPWFAAVLAAGFVVVALYCAACLAAQGLADRRAAAAEANHVVMAAAMAVMALPAGMAWVRSEVGAALFTLAALAWAVIGWRSRRMPSPPAGGAACPSPPAHLSLLDGAMAAMYVVMLLRAPVPAGSADMAGMADMGGHADLAASASSPGLLLAGGVLVLVLVVHAGRRVAVAATAPGPPPPGAGPLQRATGSARARESCQAVMSAGMAVMLVAMLAA
jgi:hypothetical protein